MSRPIRTDHSVGFGAQLALSTAQSPSTRQGESMVLTRPLSNWSVTAITDNSTDVDLVLRGSAASSSDAPMGIILSVTATSSGVTAFSTGPFAAKQVRLDVDGVSSSGGVAAWVAGAP